MTSSERELLIEEYLAKHVRSMTAETCFPPPSDTMALFRKAFLLLPSQTTDLFLSGSINLVLLVEPDPGLPLGMRTTCEGLPDSRRYSIVVYEEHLHWAEDLFVGSILRELAHVVAGQPPEFEWPSSRSERARFKELMEHQADALVWRWGLKEYSMRHLAATYPAHRLQLIVTEIERIVREGSYTDALSKH